MTGAQQANQIFDAVSRAACEMAYEYKIAEKKDQIRSVTVRECGNCDLWMKSSCKPEKERGQFKSASSITCGAFVLDGGMEHLRDQFTAELAAIEALR